MNGARVCIFAAEQCGSRNGERSEPHDGGPMAPRGRGLRPRQYGLPTTTTGTRKLVCSSSRPFWYHMVAGGRHV